MDEVLLIVSFDRECGCDASMVNLPPHCDETNRVAGLSGWWSGARANPFSRYGLFEEIMAFFFLPWFPTFLRG